MAPYHFFQVENLAICFHGKSLFLKADPKMRYTVDGVMQCPHVQCIVAKNTCMEFYIFVVLFPIQQFSICIIITSTVHVYGLRMIPDARLGRKMMLISKLLITAVCEISTTKGRRSLQYTQMYLLILSHLSTLFSKEDWKQKVNF